MSGGLYHKRFPGPCSETHAFVTVCFLLNRLLRLIKHPYHFLVLPFSKVLLKKFTATVEKEEVEVGRLEYVFIKYLIMIYYSEN